MEKIISLVLTKIKTLAQQKSENDVTEGMRRRVTCAKILTHFTCKEGMYLIINIFRNLFTKHRLSLPIQFAFFQFANSVRFFFRVYTGYSVIDSF